MIMSCTGRASARGPGRPARINIQTDIVNGERGHYLVWSVRVRVNVVAMIRVSKLLGSNYNPDPNPNFTLTLIITINITINSS